MAAENFTIGSVAEYKNLCGKVDEYNQAYYVDNSPVISDEEYDIILHALEVFENAHPESVIADSPVNKVGGGRALTGLTSQQKLFSADAVKQWVMNCRNASGTRTTDPFEVCAEIKVDGCTLALDYDNGRLVGAWLRDGGNGSHDVSEYTDFIRYIPHLIKYKKKLQVRGEAFICKSSFEAANKDQLSRGLKTYANCRNLVAGTLQNDNAFLCSVRDVQFVAWGFDKIDGIYTYNTGITVLAGLGFKTLPYMDITSGVSSLDDSISKVIKTVEDERNGGLDIPVDGIVFKVADMTKWQSIGVTEHHPKYMCAFKFGRPQVETTLTGVEWQVAKSGKVTPVAIFGRAQFPDATVNRCNMCNPSWIEKNLGALRIGDTLVVEREIIPHIIGVKHTGNGALVGIGVCPMCGAPLSHHLKADGTEGESIYCDNEQCPSRTVARTKSGKVASAGYREPSPSESNGTAFDSSSINPTALYGKSIVVSGTFPGGIKEEIKRKYIAAAGGKCTSSVTGSTYMVVAGEGMGPKKRDEALSRGVRIVTAEEFFDIIKR